MPTIHQAFHSVRVAREAGFGRSPETGAAFALETWELQPPQTAQETLARQAVNTGPLPLAPLPGRRGGEGPVLSLPMGSVAASRATGATPFSPDGWLSALFGAVLGDGAVEEAVACGGSQVVGTSGDPITVVTVESGHGSRFTAGGAVVVVHDSGTGAVPYPLFIEAVEGDALHVAGGPSEGAITAADTVLGAFALGPPTMLGESGGSLTVELRDHRGDILRLSGCVGDAEWRLDAGQPLRARFALRHHDSAWTGESAFDALDAVAWPARGVFTGAEQWVRLSVLGAESNMPFDNTLPCARVDMKYGVERAELPDVNAAQGRAGFPSTALTPRLGIITYFDTSFTTAFREGDPFAISILCGHATRGFFGLFIRRAVLATPPEHGETNRFRHHALSFVPLDPGDGLPPFVTLWA